MIKHLLSLVLLASSVLFLPATAANAASGRIPVILDTDIGFDIDDTWALAMLVKQRRFDVKLVLGSNGKHLYRARLIAKFLENVERSDIPVGVGPNQGGGASGRQSAWLGHYQLAHYPGKVYHDGIQAMIDIIMASDEPVSIITIGPLTNLAKALQRQPRIANNARVFASLGSIRKGMRNAPHPRKEYNASADAKAARQVLAAPWPVLITPLDTSGSIELTGDNYERVAESGHVVAETVIENYRAWLEPAHRHLADKSSTLLFDTLVVYLAAEQGDKAAPNDGLAKIETLPVHIAADGMTVVRPGAKPVRVATEWNDQREFHRYVRDAVARKQGFFEGWGAANAQPDWQH